MKLLLIVFFCGLLMTAFGQNKDARYFEMRTYHCNENKRPDLIRRFQDHTLRLFEKHGIKNIGYFIPTDEKNNSLTFILEYPDQAQRDVRWNNFANDPEWKEAQKKSEANGALVAKVDQASASCVTSSVDDLDLRKPQHGAPKPRAFTVMALRTVDKPCRAKI